MKIVIKIKVFKENLNKVMTKIEVRKKKIEGSYDKNQGCLEKKVFKLNKGMTKIKLSKGKIEKLNINIAKIKVTKKKLNLDIRKSRSPRKKN